MSKYFRCFLKCLQNTKYHKIKIGARDKEKGKKGRDIK